MELHRTMPDKFKLLVAQARAQGKILVPVFIKLLDFAFTPLRVLLTLRPSGGPAFIFESVESGERAGRWSFVGVHTRVHFTAFADCWSLSDFNPVKVSQDAIKQTGKGVRQAIRDFLEDHSVLEVPGLPPFTGGLIGTIGYDAARLVEPTVPDTNPDELGLPDVDLMFFDQVIAFDHVKKAMYLIELLPVDPPGPHATYERALRRLDTIQQRLYSNFRPERFLIELDNISAPVRSSLTQAEYETIVRRAKEYIAAGDIFQAVLSLRFSRPLPTSPLSLYCCLRHTNPSPHQFFIDFGYYQLVGASPEIMVNVINGTVQICPIAGTRRRGSTTEEDNEMERELRTDPKEQAEHIMLVDLSRNDAGRVCVPGTVNVVEGRLTYVVRYSSVMHLVTDITGQLKPDLHPLDALWAALPAGTLSGAPKVRAMQIIDKLETLRRGAYGGCVGFLGCNGNIETAITIRTALCKDGLVHWQVGAGIVADSDPASEYQECLRKAQAIEQAIKLALSLNGQKGGGPCKS